MRDSKALLPRAVQKIAFARDEELDITIVNVTMSGALKIQSTYQTNHDTKE